MSSGAQMPADLVWRLAATERERTAVYIRAVRRADHDKLVAFSKALDQLAESRRALDGSVSAEEAIAKESRERQATAEAELTKLKQVVEQIAAKRKSADRALAKLQSEAQQLEQLVASLTRADSVPVAPEEPIPQVEPVTQVEPSSPTPVPDQPVVEEKSETEKPAIPKAAVVAPGGLFVKGVRIAAPVKGKVLQSYGKVKVTDFSDMIFSKGLEYAAGNGSTVHAVYPGKVAYVGAMPGYETVVVVDHGGRSYSLYGRLGKSSVKIGDTVAQDQVVGSVSEVDQKGRNFYFEVRKNGTPVNPQAVLTRTSR